MRERDLVMVVSGSRYAADTHRPVIARTLINAVPAEASKVTLVHGAAPGVDTIAAALGTAWGWTILPVPAQWERCDTTLPADLGGCPARQHLRRRRDGRWFCPYAGTRRNQQMLDHVGADLAVCFPDMALGVRSGTGDLIHRAIRAGLGLHVEPLRLRRSPATRPLLTLTD